MTFVAKIGCATAIAVAAGAAQATPVMNNWTFNPLGGGQQAGQAINEFLDVNGNAFIQITPTKAGSFSFVEHAAFNIVQADSNGQLFPLNYKGGNITVLLEASGTGTFNGAFAFTGGSVKMYQNPVSGQYAGTKGIYGADLGNLIGSFDVLLGGGGMVDPTGNPVKNGQVSIRLQADIGKLKSGYFFADNGVDMSTVKTTAYAFTNANTVSRPTTNMVKELACQYANFTGPGCQNPKPGTYANVPGSYFFVGNNGQFKFNDIPEPGSIALFGIALFGIGALRRRVK